MLVLLAIVSPATIEKFVSVKALAKLGVSEIRATYGGFFLGISIFALLSQDILVFVALGIAWLSASLVRLVTIIFGSVTRKNVAGVIFESFIGLLCLSVLIR